MLTPGDERFFGFVLIFSCVMACVIEGIVFRWWDGRRRRREIAALRRAGEVKKPRELTAHERTVRDQIRRTRRPS